MTAPATPSPNPNTAPFMLSPWLIRLPILFFGWALLLTLVLVALAVLHQSNYAGRILPGVSALGLSLTGMSEAEAAAALESRFTYGSNAVFTFRAEDRVWQFSADELGVRFDAAATAAEAARIGANRDLVGGLLEQANVWMNGASIAPILSYDQNAAAAHLRAIAAEIDRPAREAALRIDGMQILKTEGQMGRIVDIPATLAALEERLLQLSMGGEVALVIRESTPAVMSVDASAERIEAALSGPLRLVASDENGAPLGPWTISVDQIAALLRMEIVNEADGSQRIDAQIDMSVFADYLQTLAPGLITAPKDGRFHFNEFSGQLEVIQPSASGRELDIPTTLARLQESVFQRENRVVPMAFTFNLPRYHNQITAAELGIREMVAEATTYFSGSTINRRQNIAVSASRYDGLIIAPGEEFSFNAHVGEISVDEGYVQGKVIFGGRTIDDVGGGVCQVSTTVFRAAFNGGFAITERNSHGYRVGFYELRGQPTGLDAAIWKPERDFKFQNNTPYHLLMEVDIFPGDDAIQFRFYSTRHWVAEIDAPIVKNIKPALATRYEVNNNLQPGQIEQVDYSAEGADVTVYRTIYDVQGNKVREDYIYTHYLPWGAIFQVPPGDSRLANSG